MDDFGLILGGLDIVSVVIALFDWLIMLLLLGLKMN